MSCSINLALKYFLILVTLGIFALIVFYVFQVNAEVLERYSIQEYEVQFLEKVANNQKLEMKLIGSNSLASVSDVMDQLDFVKVGKIDYIKVRGNQVVKK